MKTRRSLGLNLAAACLAAIGCALLGFRLGCAHSAELTPAPSAQRPPADGRTSPPVLLESRTGADSRVANAGAQVAAEADPSASVAGDRLVAYYCRVENPAGDPIRDVDASFGDCEAQSREHARSDFDGLVKFELSTALLQYRCLGHIRFDRSGWAPVFVQPEPRHGEPSSPQHVVMSQGGTLQVSVVLGPDVPATGYTVRVVAGGGDMLHAVDQPGFLRMTVANGVTEDPVTGEGRPIVAGLQPLQWVQPCDPGGLARFESLPCDTPLEVIVIGPSGQWCATRSIAVIEQGEAVALRIEIPGLGSVHGVLRLAGGQAVADCPMIAFRPNTEAVTAFVAGRQASIARTRTKQDGSFEIPALVAGEYFVGPRLPESDPRRGTAIPACASRVTVRAGESTDMGTLVPGSAAFLRGTVVNEAGAAVAGASLLLTVAGERAYLEAQSDLDGAFDFGPVPGGKYSLSATGPAGAAFENLALDGQTSIACTLVLEPRGSVHAVISPDALQTTRVIVWARLGGATKESWEYRGADQEVTFEQIPQGSYELWATFGDGSAVRRTQVEITKGAPVLEIQLQSGPCATLDVQNETTMEKLEFRLLSKSGARMVQESFAPRKRVRYHLPPGPVHAEIYNGPTLVEERDLQLDSSVASEFRFGN